MHARKRELALQTRKLTLNLMAWSTVTLVDGNGEDFAIPDDLLQRESRKLAGLRKIQVDSFLPDDLRRQAVLLDHAPEAGVACTTVFFLDSGELARMETRDREGQRGNGVVS